VAITFDPVWLILKRPRPNLDPQSFLAPGVLSIERQRATFGPSEARLLWPTSRASDTKLTMDRIVGVRRKRYGWGVVPRLVAIQYETDEGIRSAYFNDGEWHGWRPLLTGSNMRMLRDIRRKQGSPDFDRPTDPEPAVGGRQSESGDHVVEGLNDSLVESCKDLLQMTARHDQLAKCGIVCFAR
jgi:hypothetical protein